MYTVQVEIFNDRKVYIETLNAGTNGENGATNLKFVVPKDYSGFYKYLDIITTDGNRTQTVVGDRENNIFYYILPYSLTGQNDITLQLVMKNKNTVFKSNLFTLTFNQSVEGTQYLEDNFQDTIEFLMENKTDKSESEKLLSQVNSKLDSEEFYRYKLSSLEEILKKADENEVCEKISNLTDIVHNKVDKETGKGLSSSDYTEEEKNKLSELPDNKKLNELLKGKASLIYVDATEENFSYDNYKENGIYFFVIQDGDSYSVHTLKVWWEFDILCQKRDNSFIRNQQYDTEWSEWERINYEYTTEEKNKVEKIDKNVSTINTLLSDLQGQVALNSIDISDLKTQTGNIDSALDELHNYAQALIFGGEA